MNDMERYVFSFEPHPGDLDPEDRPRRTVKERLSFRPCRELRELGFTLKDFIE